MPAPASAVVVCVPEAEPWVDDLRRRHDPVHALGVPAHITVLHPFVAPAQLTPALLARLAAALAGVPAFDFSLAQVGCFAGVAYLAPVPAAPFVALTLAVAAAFPDCPPYGGEHDTLVPHLTVAQGDAAALRQAAAELALRLRERGPVHARCRRLSLLTRRGERWRVWRQLPLH